MAFVAAAVTALGSVILAAHISSATSGWAVLGLGLAGIVASAMAHGVRWLVHAERPATSLVNGSRIAFEAFGVFCVIILAALFIPSTSVAATVGVVVLVATFGIELAVLARRGRSNPTLPRPVSEDRRNATRN